MDFGRPKPTETRHFPRNHEYFWRLGISSFGRPLFGVWLGLSHSFLTFFRVNANYDFGRDLAVLGIEFRAATCVIMGLLTVRWLFWCNRTCPMKTTTATCTLQSTYICIICVYVNTTHLRPRRRWQLHPPEQPLEQPHLEHVRFFFEPSTPIHP
jgi:hypothetical protein